MLQIYQKLKKQKELISMRQMSWIGPMDSFDKILSIEVPYSPPSSFVVYKSGKKPQAMGINMAVVFNNFLLGSF